MARAYHVIWAGRHRRGPWEALCADYRTRIGHSIPVEDRPVRARAAASDPSRRKAEGEALRAALPDPCWLIALDSGGRTLSSESLSKRLGSIGESWPHEVAFVIGSDLGLDRSIIESARFVLSFGPMTLGHELARLVLYEQLYRSVAIAQGIKYHRPRL